MKYDLSTLVSFLFCFVLHAEQTITNEVLCSFEFDNTTTNEIKSGDDKFVVDAYNPAISNALSLRVGHVELSENTFNSIEDEYTIQFDCIIDIERRNTHGLLISTSRMDAFSLWMDEQGFLMNYRLHMRCTEVFHKLSDLRYLRCVAICKKELGMVAFYVNGHSVSHIYRDIRRSSIPTIGLWCGVEYTEIQRTNFVSFGQYVDISNDPEGLSEFFEDGTWQFPGRLLNVIIYRYGLSVDDISMLSAPPKQVNLYLTEERHVGLTLHCKINPVFLPYVFGRFSRDNKEWITQSIPGGWNVESNQTLSKGFLWSNWAPMGFETVIIKEPYPLGDEAL